MLVTIIADDLTGAADTGIQFARRGFYTILFPFGFTTKPASFDKDLAIVINTNSRGMKPEAAYGKVRGVSEDLKSLKPQIIYKKIDSTLRGNVGAEIKAVLDATGYEFAVVAPAFPANKRTTINGVHLVNGQPLSKTEAAFDLVSPVKESHIPALIQSQTGLKVRHIEIKRIRAGNKCLESSILQCMKSDKIIVMDAVTDDDLMIIAKSCISTSPRPLMVGSAGLADQLSRLLKPAKAPQPEYKKGREGKVIVISGSLSSVTSRQLEELCKKGKGHILPLEIHKFIQSEEKWIDRIAAEIVSYTEGSEFIGIQSVIKGERPQQELSNPVAESLGELALRIIKSCPQPVSAIILIGGDTSLAVFAHLGISQLQLIDEILPGVPYSKVTGGELAGIGIVTKAGAFGDKNALVKCIDFLVQKEPLTE